MRRQQRLGKCAVTQPSAPTRAAWLYGRNFFRKPWTKWAVILGGWTLLSLIFAPEVYLYFLYKNEPLPFSHVFALTAANAGIAAAFAPFIIWLTHRFPLGHGRWAGSLLVHVPACLAFSIGHSTLYAALCYASPQLFHTLFLRFHPNLITYWAIVGFTEAINYFQKYEERERQLAQAQLELLKSQLHPHFLFNTLHTISAMMHDDAKGADRMISRLSDLLRLTLESIGKHEVPFKQELDFVQRYLEVERVRFQERLTLTLDVEAEVLDALVPSMLLQPLVENSIRHGFGSRKNTGAITIQARRREGVLALKVIDNGRGFAGEASERLGQGLGLSNIHRRLQQLYEANHRFQMESPPSGGAAVTVEIPFHIAAPDESVATPELMVDEDSGANRRRRALGAKAHRDAVRN